MEKVDVTRRSFLGLLGAVAASPAVAAIPSTTVAEEIIPIEYGFIPYFDSEKYGSFSEIITTTLKNNRYLVEENIAKHNPLFLNLKGNKKLHIKPIDHEMQTKRMIAKLEARTSKKDKELIAQQEHQRSIDRGLENYCNLPLAKRGQFANIWRPDYET